MRTLLSLSARKTDVRDSISTVCYKPNGNGFVVGCITGNCRFYQISGVVGMSSISSSHSGDVIENVHSGAPPPWLNANDGNAFNVQLNQPETARKTCKLNPKRVGAAWAEMRKIEIEMEKSGQAMTTLKL